MKLSRSLLAAVSVFILSFFLSAVPVAAKQQPVVTVSLSQYTPGQTAYLTVSVSGKKVPFDLQVHYGNFNQWWAGGSGPATTTGGLIYWMDCRNSACTMFWSGQLPKGKQTAYQLVIPLTTTTYAGTWPDAITVSGTVDGMPFYQTLSVTQTR